MPVTPPCGGLQIQLQGWLIHGVPDPIPRASDSGSPGRAWECIFLTGRKVLLLVPGSSHGEPCALPAASYTAGSPAAWLGPGGRRKPTRCVHGLLPGPTCPQHPSQREFPHSGASPKPDTANTGPLIFLDNCLPAFCQFLTHLIS